MFKFVCGNNVVSHANQVGGFMNFYNYIDVAVWALSPFFLSFVFAHCLQDSDRSRGVLSSTHRSRFVRSSTDRSRAAPSRPSVLQPWARNTTIGTTSKIETGALGVAVSGRGALSGGMKDGMREIRG